MTKENTKTIEKDIFIIPQNIAQAQAQKMDDNVFTKRLTKLGEKLKDSREEVQFLGLHCMLAMYASGNNTDHANRLFNTLGNTLSESSQEQFKEWLLICAPVRYVKIVKDNGDASYSFRMDKETKDETTEQWQARFDFLSAVANPWFTVKMISEKKFKALLSFLSVENRLKKLLKDSKDAITNEQVESEEDANRLLALIPLLESIVGIPSASKAPETLDLTYMEISNDSNESSEVKAVA